MMAAELLAIALGVTFLHAFYRAIESNWPASYYAAGRKTDRAISANPARYALFRFGPPCLVSAVVGAALARAGQAVLVPAIAVGLLHGTLSAGRAITSIWRRGNLRSRPLVVGLNVLVLILLLFVSYLGGVASHFLVPHVPTMRDLATALWTALFAGVVGAFLVKLTSAEEPSSYQLFGITRRQIPDTLWETAMSAAVESNADPRLVGAFMLVESQQRPAWVRQLERQAGRLLGAGTYGPLQVGSDGPLDDEDSIKLAVAQRFAGRALPNKKYGDKFAPDYKWLEVLALQYNPDKGYADDVMSAYLWLEYSGDGNALAACESRASDGLANLEVLEMRTMSSGTLYVNGTCGIREACVIIGQLGAMGSAVGGEAAPVPIGATGRYRWEVRLELALKATDLMLGLSLDGQSVDETCVINLPIPWTALR